MKTNRSLSSVLFSLVLFAVFLTAASLYAASTIQFNAATYAVAENGGTATVIVERASDTNTVVSVDYATVDGTATAGLDYTSAKGTLNFAAGETNQTFTVPILNDGLVEPAETFQVLLSNPTVGGCAGDSRNRDGSDQGQRHWDPIRVQKLLGE